MPEEDLNGNCPMVAESEWIHAPTGNHHLMVSSTGPAGSGHYSTITVAVQNRGEQEQVHGVCLTTATIGWRILQQFNHKPLTWIDDIDKDGNAEIILWTSFPLREDPTSIEFGLMGWVYRLSSENTLRIDVQLSRKIAQELAKEYQEPIRTSEAILFNRDKAAKALQSFASGACHFKE